MSAVPGELAVTAPAAAPVAPVVIVATRVSVAPVSPIMRATTYGTGGVCIACPPPATPVAPEALVAVLSLSAAMATIITDVLPFTWLTRHKTRSKFKYENKLSRNLAVGVFLVLAVGCFSDLLADTVCARFMLENLLLSTFTSLLIQSLYPSHY